MEKKINVSNRRGKDIEISKIMNKHAGSGRNIALSIIGSAIAVSVTLIGTVFTFTSMFNIRVSTAALAVVCVLLSLLFTASFKAPKSIKFLLPAAGVLLAGVTAIFWGDVVKGFNLVYADVVGGINHSMAWALPVQQYVRLPAYTISETLIISLVAVLLAALLALCMAYRTSVVGVLLITLPFFLSGTAFGAVPSHIAASMLVSGWVACIVMRLAGVKTRGEKKYTGFVDHGRKHIFAKTGDSVISLGVGVASMAVSLAIMLALSAYAGQNSMRSGNINSLRITVSEKLQEMLSLTKTGRTQSSLSDGDLATIGNRVVKNKPYVRVKAPKFQSGKTQYLKGFVGTLYTGNSWVGAQDYSDWADMFGEFASAQLYPQNFSGAVLSSIAKTNGVLGASFKNVSILPVVGGASYAYTFYNSFLGNEFKFNHDTTTVPPGKSYSYNVFTEEVSDDEFASAPLKNDPAFNNLWDKYQEYVYHEYLMLPVNGLDSFKTLYQTTKRQNIFDYGKYIHDELETDKSYNNNTGRVPVGKDFTEYFMFTQKKGFCVHFATAATLMFRAAGIPARYVEGYIIPQSAYDGITPDEDGNYEIMLTDAHAHAWVEVFDNDLGWTLFDATPGYYDKSIYTENIKSKKKEKDLQNSKRIKDKNSKEYVDKKHLESEKKKPAELREHGEIDPGNRKTRVDSPLYFAIRDALKIWFGWAVAISGLFLLVGLLAIRRFLSSGSRRKKFESGARPQIVKNVYQYFTKVLFYELIENKDNLPYLKFAKLAAEKSSHLNADETEKAMKIFLKVKFSKTGEVTAEETEYVKAFAEKYAKDVYTAATPAGRWIFATIRGLY